MSEPFQLEMQLRHQIGTSASKRLRRQSDFVPAIMYGGGEAAKALQIEHRILSKALENEAFFTHILNVRVDGADQKAILRAVQRHPFKPQILHVDFMRVTGKELITMSVPLHFINEEASPGVKLQGGMVEHAMMKVEIKCRADSMPEYIEVDLGKMELNQSFHLSDLSLPKGAMLPELALGADHDHIVVSIHPPQRGTTAAEAAASEESAE